MIRSRGSKHKIFFFSFFLFFRLVYFILFHFIFSFYVFSPSIHSLILASFGTSPLRAFHKTHPQFTPITQSDD
ncbi:hypothetical protein BDV25DRAFT_151830 [Aspergillus avenaceus]|uniref:Uncharacterized protein n=1 Tax=Aspergillus avenaceus TaxID=36643 RepID=A0A5N6U041_ASPAV|nr:hypothetical protein BDV25DRAFT_151830 [Aspergillus avenaceus]